MLKQSVLICFLLFTVQCFSQQIQTGTITGSPFSLCAGTAVSVPFTASCTFAAGNVFTAQISNASGSFATPTTMGTLTATTSGTISANFPLGTVNGTGYRIRVISSNPASTGTDNGVNITMSSPAELCDNIDNNCNGIIDELLTRSCYSGPPGTAGVGQCLAGIQTCSAGSWGTCNNQVTPASETCDGLDNDCDGATDESTSGSAPAVSNFSATASTICQGVGTVVTVTSSTLLKGKYTVTYNVTGTNSISSTNVTMIVASNGAGGTFTTAVLNTPGASTVNLTAIVFASTNCNSSSALSASAGVTVNATVAASVSISANPGNTICAYTGCSGTNVTFTAAPINGGGSPSYQWKLNGAQVGTNSATYSNNTLVAGSAITCVMTSNATCPTGNPATSNVITMASNPQVTASVSIAANPTGAVCTGTSITFTATPVNGGVNPTYNFKVGGSSVQSGTSDTYTTSTLLDNQSVTCEMTSTINCPASNPVTSSAIVTDIISCTNTWLGTNSTWANTSNWSNGSAPAGCSDDVIINATANNPVITSSVTVGDINIQSGAGLTINSTLNVCGDITVADATVAGNGTLNISGSGIHTLTGTLHVNGIVNVSSGATLVTNSGLILENNASLMHGSGTPGAGGSVSGTVTVKRQGTNNSGNYNYWSGPVAGANVPGNNIYYYNPASGTNGYADDNNPNPDGGWIGFSGAMTAGRGYASKAGGLASFTGTPNNGTITIGVTTSSEPISSVNTPSKFNLIGNPYPSSISASSLYTANSGIIAYAFYFWNDDGSGGNDYAANDYAKYTNLGGTAASIGGPTPNGNISSGQGFISEVISGGNVQFFNSMRGTSNSMFFKTQEDISKLWLSLNNETHYSEILIGFAPDATDQRDYMYDAYNLRGNSAMALAAMQENDEFGIVAFPPVTSEKIIPLTVYTAAEDLYTITNKADENFSGLSVFLEDRLSGTFTAMADNGSYTCMMNADNTTDRFFLHFANLNTGISATPAASISAYQSQNELIILTHNFTATQANIIIADITGAILQEENAAMFKNGTCKTDITKLAAGVYLVTLHTQNNSYSKKIIIK